MKIYVASSWRNAHQQKVVAVLRADGHDVYDFRNPHEGDNGFSWREVDPEAANWPNDPNRFIACLSHPCSERGFSNDMTALRNCDACSLFEGKGKIMNCNDEIIEKLVDAAFSVLSHDTDPRDANTGEAHRYGQRVLRKKFKAILKAAKEVKRKPKGKA